MPSLAAISKIDFPFKVDQQEVKQRAKELFVPSFPQVERMLSAFDNTEIKTRNFCKPLQYYSTPIRFGNRMQNTFESRLNILLKRLKNVLLQHKLKRTRSPISFLFQLPDFPLRV